MSNDYQSPSNQSASRGPRLVEVGGRRRTLLIIVGVILFGLLAGGVWWVVREKVKRAEAEEAAQLKGPVVEDPGKLENDIREIQHTIPRALRAVERHEHHITIRIDKEFYALPPSEKRRFYTKIRTALRNDAPAFNVILQDYYTGEIRVTIEAARFHEH